MSSVPTPLAASAATAAPSPALGPDLRGGLATLLGSVCIAAPVPAILNGQGDAGQVTTVAATALACVVGTLLFAVVTRLPFGVGPGLVPASIMASLLAGGTPLATVLGIELVAGLAFAGLVALGVVGRGVRRMPPMLKTAGEIAIGLYLLLAALRAGGVMLAEVADQGAPTLGAGAWLFLAGVATVFLLARHRVLGGYATLLGVGVAAVGSAAFGLVKMPDHAWALPALRLQWPDVRAALDWHHLDDILVLLYVVMVDVVATLETLARCEPALQQPDGSLRNFDRALRTSAGVFVLSPLLGTEPMLVFFESMGGVLSGARTARAAVVVALGFAVVMVYSPLATAVPVAACAVALAFVGYSITKHAVLSMPLTSADKGEARLARHLATVALLLVVAANYLAVALFGLFVLYPMLAYLSDQKVARGQVIAALLAGMLLVVMLR